MQTSKPLLTLRRRTPSALCMPHTPAKTLHANAGSAGSLPAMSAPARTDTSFNIQAGMKAWSLSVRAARLRAGCPRSRQRAACSRYRACNRSIYHAGARSSPPRTLSKRMPRRARPSLSRTTCPQTFSNSLQHTCTSLSKRTRRRPRKQRGRWPPPAAYARCSMRASTPCANSTPSCATNTATTRPRSPLGRARVTSNAPRAANRPRRNRPRRPRPVRVRHKQSCRD